MTDDSRMLHQWQRQWIARIQKMDTLGVVTTEENRMGSVQSPIHIYKHNIQQRLTESLAFSYPALLAEMGEVAFTELIIAFLAVNLPDDPDLMLYGDGLASFLRNRIVNRHDYAELARLEWFLHECTLTHQHPLAICEIDASVSLGKMSGHNVILERRPRILRTTTTNLTRVAPITRWIYGLWMMAPVTHPRCLGFARWGTQGGSVTWACLLGNMCSFDFLPTPAKFGGSSVVWPL